LLTPCCIGKLKHSLALPDQTDQTPAPAAPAAPAAVAGDGTRRGSEGAGTAPAAATAGARAHALCAQAILLAASAHAKCSGSGSGGAAAPSPFVPWQWSTAGLCRAARALVYPRSRWLRDQMGVGDYMQVECSPSPLSDYMQVEQRTVSSGQRTENREQ
jgi:hypothetical protein